MDRFTLLPWSKELIAYGELGLFLLAFADSSVLPIPPEVIFIPLSLINPTLTFYYALIATLGSVSGGIIGYYIGLKGGRKIAKRLLTESLLIKLEGYFNKYGITTVIIGAALTLLPCKVFTIGAGLGGLDLKKFILAYSLGRAVRFLEESIIIMLWGEEIMKLIFNNLEIITIITVLSITGYFVIKKLLNVKRI